VVLLADFCALFCAEFMEFYFYFRA
jgi:hypothetical protein